MAGLYVQIESVSLSRAIPAGLGWALRPYVESVPRESLEFTLRSARDAIAEGRYAWGFEQNAGILRSAQNDDLIT